MGDWRQKAPLIKSGLQIDNITQTVAFDDLFEAFAAIGRFHRQLIDRACILDGAGNAAIVTQSDDNLARGGFDLRNKHNKSFPKAQPTPT